MNFRFYFTIGICFMLAGFLIDSGSIIELVHHRNNSSAAQVYAEASKDSKADKKLITGFPNHIDIPSVSISLPVKQGQYDSSTQAWTLSNDSAYFASSTLPPNNMGGNTFIYGHDIQSVFARLNNIKQGDKVMIKTSNGHVFTYKFIDSNDTIPEDTSLFTYKGKPVLTLQTCSGFFSQNRRMFVFSLDGIQ